jgi:hypothetical protein
MERFKCELIPSGRSEDTPYTSITLCVYKELEGSRVVHWTAIEHGTTAQDVSFLFSVAKRCGYTFRHKTHAEAIATLVRKLHINAYTVGCIDRESGCKTIRDNAYRSNDWANRARYWLLGFNEQPPTGFDELVNPALTEIVSDSLMGLLQ